VYTLDLFVCYSYCCCCCVVVVAVAIGGAWTVLEDNQPSIDLA